jgi:hypothetical protein
MFYKERSDQAMTSSFTEFKAYRIQGMCMFICEREQI